jgi:hypothetical protein
MDQDKLFKWLCTSQYSVHKQPNNVYQNFINAFMLLNCTNQRRALAVKEAQKEWKKICLLTDESSKNAHLQIYWDQAAAKMKKISAGFGTMWRFVSKEKVSPYQYLGLILI